MNWHEPSPEEIEGKGEYRYIIDVYPEHMPHQAGKDGDALIRLARPGWVWWFRDLQETGGARVGESGYADTREAALADATSALTEARRKNEEREAEPPEKKGWFGR